MNNQHVYIIFVFQPINLSSTTPKQVNEKNANLAFEEIKEKRQEEINVNVTEQPYDR